MCTVGGSLRPRVQWPKTPKLHSSRNEENARQLFFGTSNLPQENVEVPILRWHRLTQTTAKYSMSAICRVSTVFRVRVAPQLRSAQLSKNPQGPPHGELHRAALPSFDGEPTCSRPRPQDSLDKSVTSQAGSARCRKRERPEDHPNPCCRLRLFRRPRFP